MALLSFASSGCWADDDRIRVINVFGRGGLDHEDAQAIADRVSNVARAEMKLSERMKVGVGATHLEAAVIVDEHSTPRANFAGGATWPLDLGTFVSESDHAEGSKVAVIGWPVRDRLFRANAKPLGEQVFIAGIGFRVIGVLGAHPPFVDDLLPDLQDDWDEEKTAVALATRVYVPFNAGRNLFSATAKNNALIRVWVKDQASIDATRTEVRQVLEQRTGRPVMLQIVTFPPSSTPTADNSFGDTT
ncbi:MAG: ABC transporter permease [Gammaproteobacteria bacterium]|nr:ABC transporter permease [Gammaproteobacteria bacterium]